MQLKFGISMSAVALVVSLFASAATLPAQHFDPPAQHFDYDAYLRRTWSNPSRLSAQKFMARAAREGHLPTPQSRALAKRAWRKIVGGGRGLRLGQKASGAALDAGASPAQAVLLDREYNGTLGFADEAAVLTPAGLQIDGSILANGNTDCYRFRTVADGVVQVQLTGRGTSPVPYGDFAIYNEKGYLVRLAEGSTTNTATLKLELPRGAYYVIVDAPAAGDYRLDCRFTVSALAILPLSGTTNATLARGDEAMFRLTLPADGVFRLKINGGALDTFLTLQSSILTYMFDVDDDSTSTGTDAGLHAHLAKGVYYISIATDAPGSISISTSFTPRVVPALPCNGSVDGSITGGQEDFALYRFTLASTQEVQIKLVGRGTTSPIQDSYLFFYDTLSNEIMESDDDYAFVGSIAAGTLPPATYYAASTGYWDKGDYTISSACSAPVTVAAAPGSTTRGAIPRKDAHVTFVCTLGTSAGLEFRVYENSLPDAMLGLVDAATGLAVGWDDDTLFGQADCQVDNRFAQGVYHAIVKDFGGDDGNFDLTIHAPKMRAGASLQLRGLGKSGDFAILVVSAKTVPGFGVGVFRGLFQLDLSLGFVIGPALLPANGELDFGFQFPLRTGAVLQSLHLDPKTLGGAFTNLLR